MARDEVQHLPLLDPPPALLHASIVLKMVWNYEYPHSSIFLFLGSLTGWNSFGGPGLYMARAMVFRSGSLPFIIGAGKGFTVGLWKHYIHSLTQAIVGLEDFSSLMLLHLDANYPNYR